MLFISQSGKTCAARSRHLARTFAGEASFDWVYDRDAGGDHCVPDHESGKCYYFQKDALRRVRSRHTSSTLSEDMAMAPIF